MAYDAKVLEVMIASPGNVLEERSAVRDVLSEWNAVYSRERKVVLLSLGWDTHSSPELSGRPQQLINDRILAHADLLIGLFWNRVGSPTGKASSGTVEEIKEHHAAGKPVMLYFSEAPEKASDIDPDQLKKLQEFRKWAKSKGIIKSYHSPADFKEKFRQDLPTALRDNQTLKALITPAGMSANAPLAETSPLSNEAREMLQAAADDPNGCIMLLADAGGVEIATGSSSRVFAQSGDRRGTAKWTAAAEELQRAGLMRDDDGKRQVFAVTNAGYEILDG